VFSYISHGGLLELDDIERAGAHLGELSKWVHVDPYATATFGLYHMKKGNIERAKQLYEESKSLVKDDVMKKRIRQRMYLEMGKAYLTHNDNKLAERYLVRAINEKRGNLYAKKEASKILNAIKG